MRTNSCLIVPIGLAQWQYFTHGRIQQLSLYIGVVTGTQVSSAAI